MVVPWYANTSHITGYGTQHFDTCSNRTFHDVVYAQNGSDGNRAGRGIIAKFYMPGFPRADLFILAEAEIGVMVYEEREGGYQVCFDIDFEDLRDIEVVEAELFGIVIEDHGYPALAQWLIEEETLVQAAFDNAEIDPSDLNSGD